MGTYADFYIGHGDNAEWLGSIRYDGYEFLEDPECELMTAKHERDFRDAVVNIALERDDFGAPNNGWPWPWPTSRNTDFAYVFDDGQTHVYYFGRNQKTAELRTDWRVMKQEPVDTESTGKGKGDK